MKRFASFTLFLFFAITIMGCKKDDPSPDHPAGVLNKPPQAFQVQVLSVDYDGATITWDQARDADGDPLHYALYLDDSLVLNNITTGYLYHFENLQPLTGYQGRIEVSDSVNAPVAVDFGFSTPAYFNTFDRTFTSSTCNIQSGYSLLQTNDKGYLIASKIACETQYPYLLKTDSLGAELWHKKIDLICGHGNILLNECQNGDLLITANSKIIRTDSGGNVKWNYEDGYSDFMGTAERQDGKIVTFKSINNVTMTLLSADGNMIWTRQNLNRNCLYLSFAMMNSGDLALMYTFSDSRGSLAGAARLDPEGTVIWDKNLDLDCYKYFAGKIITSTDGSLVCVILPDEDYKYESTVIKMDVDGNELWRSGVAIDGNRSLLYDIEQTPDSGYILCGQYMHYSHPGTLLVKLTNSGVLQWSRKFMIENINYYTINLYDIKPTADDGFVATGYKSVQNYSSDRNLWLLKTDNKGNL